MICNSTVQNGLGVEGATHLCECLKTNSSLKQLNLGFDLILFILFFLNVEFLFFAPRQDGNKVGIWEKKTEQYCLRNRDFSLSENEAHKKFIGHRLGEYFCDISIDLKEKIEEYQE